MTEKGSLCRDRKETGDALCGGRHFCHCEPAVGLVSSDKGDHFPETDTSAIKEWLTQSGSLQSSSLYPA